MRIALLRRRNFISLVGGAAAWPLAASGQQAERVRRIAAFSGVSGDDPESQARFGAFVEVLQQLGWDDGRNVRIDLRWGGGDPNNIRKQAVELAALAPDVILVTGGAATEQLLRATRTVPIVFVIVPDPVGSGLVNRLSRPGGNITGFMAYEYNLSGKWLELLKQIAPGVKQAAVLRDPALTAGIGMFAVIQSVASSLGVEVLPINVGNVTEIDGAIDAFAGESNGGLIVTPGAWTAVHRELIATVAARHRLPAVYGARFFVASGGLISYGPNYVDQFRRAAGYVDRILKGEKPADLPVQAPTKYELAINLKTAKALGIDVPATLLARADDVIE
jgi:putative ABC transport system substrate-binding protein